MTDAFDIPSHAEHYSVVLMRERGGGFLLQRRARRKDMLYAGRIGLFGGRRESAETPEATAIREVAEECGVALEASKLTLLARLLAQDEWGALSYGHIYFSEDLSHEAAKAALRFRCEEGKAVLLSQREARRRAGELTSITLYALSAHADYAKARVAGAPAPLLSFLGLRRRES